MNMRPSFDPALRRSIEDEIERLLTLLDGMDPEPDMEPELGWTMHGLGCPDGGPTDDREGDEEREADEAESGIADFDALHSEDTFLNGWTGDRSGHVMAERMLAALPARSVRT